MPNGLPKSLPGSMTAIAIREPGGPDVLVPQQLLVPSPGEGERNLLHGLAQCVRARQARRRRNAARSRRLVRNRHHGNSARQAFGARVIVTAGTAEKCDACRKLGADLAINYNTEDFVALSKQATLGRGVELILDMVGGDYVGRNYEAAAVEGRIVQIAFQTSSRVTLDLMRLMLKRLTHTGSTLRARAVADKAAIAAAFDKNVLPLLASGRVKPPIDSTFPLHQASAAHARMESGKHIGKIVLTL
jgi:NADPH:quinone reductase-like Zn-dependent oxidoreductase